jgi:hypothetical protein
MEIAMKKKTCNVAECGRPAMLNKHGLCLAHYQRYRRTGGVGAALIRPKRVLPPFNRRVNKGN